MPLGDEQLDRYARHIVLREVGGTGQLRLLNARAAIIGAGGLGAPAIQYLAAAGLGHLTIIDDDRVALSNLQRQVLFGTADVGHVKVDAAARAVARMTPDVTVMPVEARIDANNAAALLGNHDVIIDGCDNFATRLAVAEAALALRIPLVSAAVGQFEGQLATYRGWEAGKPCYRCFVGDDPAREEASCADQGVLGALTGVIGSWAALEAIREIVRFGEDAAGRLVLFDALSLRVRTLALPKDPACPACGNGAPRSDGRE